MTKRKHRDPREAAKAAIAALGGRKATGDIFGITGQAVSQWDIIPIERVAEVARLTGISLEELRPDHFRK